MEVIDTVDISISSEPADREFGFYMPKITLKIKSNNVVKFTPWVGNKPQSLIVDYQIKMTQDYDLEHVTKYYPF